MAKGKPETVLTHGGKASSAGHDFINPPIVRGSTVLHASVADMKERSRRYRTDEPGAVNYGLYGTPTHHALFELLTELEGGYKSWAVPSGLAACTITMLAFLRAGDHVLVSDSAYGPTRRFCIETLPRYGVQSSFYAPAAGREIEAQFRPNTRLLWLESPGSLTFEMQDVRLLVELARKRGVVTAIDNTWATPLYFQPLKCGVDVSVHAATKYICGHSDMLMGTITCTQPAWGPLRQILFNLGLVVSPEDAYIALRGLRSLAARLRQHRATAERLMQWLLAQPEVDRILYPALPSDPGYELWKRDMSGATGLFGIVMKQQAGGARLNALVDAVQVFGRGYSWGGYESLLVPVYPDRSVAPCDYEGRLFRISAGLEDADDLIDDLKRGFAALRAC
jgi:cysteine-S-conjugate beta-lyase